MSWFILVITLIFQEFASMGAALLAAHNAGVNSWIIHAIWLTATAADITIGYYFGKWIQHRFHNSKLDAWAKKWAGKIEHATGRTGIKISLMLLGFVTYPYLLSFAASWLPNIILEDIFIYTTIGDLVWYGFIWATVLGIAAAGHNYPFIFLIIAGAGITIVLISNVIKKKIET